jgi:cell division protein FtsB
MVQKISKGKQAAKDSSKKNVPKKAAKKKNSSRLGVAFFFVIIFAVVLVATVFSDLQQVFENKRQTKELSDRYIELLEEEAALSSQVIKLQDPEYRARYARENQMYTKDGETILIIIDKDKKKIIDEDE